jgi:hypothetical protein
MHGTSQEQLLSGSAPDSHLSGTDNIRDVSTATKVVIGLLGEAAFGKIRSVFSIRTLGNDSTTFL